MPAEPAPFVAEKNSPPSNNGRCPSAPQPISVEETGVELSLLADLMLKTIHFTGRPTARQVTQQLKLSFAVTEEVIGFLRQEEALEIVGTAGLGEQAYQYELTERGRTKAQEALARSQYVGPAPVSFDNYTDIQRQQSARDIRIDRETFREGLSHLVLGPQVLAALGPAFNSGRSVLIYGASGNGKSSITMAVGEMLPGQVLIPYAVEVHGQIVRVFDPRVHHAVPIEDDLKERRQGVDSPPSGDERRRDQRWVTTKRPVVSVGGELTMQDLDLRYSPQSQFYIAPLQWKANGGVLIIDDFGRQMIAPQELLNRWIVPMEQGVDHLTLHTGDSIELPFDTLLIFSSNIPPGKLGDEAFFRRIRHKVEIPNPTTEEFLTILRIVAKERGVQYTEEGARYLISTYYEQGGRELKSCHPRDLLDLLVDISGFFEQPPVLSPQWLDLACTSYFVDVPETADHILNG